MAGHWDRCFPKIARYQGESLNSPALKATAPHSHDSLPIDIDNLKFINGRLSVKPSLPATANPQTSFLEFDKSSFGLNVGDGHSVDLRNPTPCITMDQKNRDARFATTAEIRYNPANHFGTQEYDDHASGVASDEADCGYGGVRVHSRKRGEEGYPLMDWSGGFAPAPIDWDQRPAFFEAKMNNRIQEWMARSEPAFVPYPIEGLVESLGRPTAIAPDDWEDTQSFEYCYWIDQHGSFRKTLLCEIAPRSWYPLTIDGESTNDWWSEHIKDPVVFDEFPPWWMRYPNPVDEFITVPPNPPVALDPSDNAMYKVREQTSMSSSKTFDAKQYRRNTNERSKHSQLKAEAQRANSFDCPASGNAPRINLYLRPVQEKDVPQIRLMYDHYITTTTIACPEMEPIDAEAVKHRLRCVRDVKLPFLVAVDRTVRPVKQRPVSGVGNVLHEKILGFAFADDFNDVRGMYRYTAEVELFTHPDFTRLGIANCLLDKIISIVDSTYVDRGGYDFRADIEPTAYMPGGRRTISSVVVNLPYDGVDRSALEWQIAWLSKFGFEQVGDLPDIGRKRNTRVNQAILIKKTGISVAAWAI